jgi:hypothetical protein
VSHTLTHHPLTLPQLQHDRSKVAQTNKTLVEGWKARCDTNAIHAHRATSTAGHSMAQRDRSKVARNKIEMHQFSRQKKHTPEADTTHLTLCPWLHKLPPVRTVAIQPGPTELLPSLDLNKLRLHMRCQRCRCGSMLWSDNTNMHMQLCTHLAHGYHLQQEPHQALSTLPIHSPPLQNVHPVHACSGSSAGPLFFPCKYQAGNHNKILTLPKAV